MLYFIFRLSYLLLYVIFFFSRWYTGAWKCFSSYFIIFISLNCLVSILKAEKKERERWISYENFISNEIAKCFLFSERENKSLIAFGCMPLCNVTFAPLVAICKRQFKVVVLLAENKYHMQQLKYPEKRLCTISSCERCSGEKKYGRPNC